MPVQHRVDEERLLGLGLVNYWGYNTIGLFAPEPRYWSGRAGTTPRERVPRDGRRAARARHRGGARRGLQPHAPRATSSARRCQLRGIDNALLLPAARRTTGRATRTGPAAATRSNLRRAARAAAGDGQPALLGDRDSASTASASTWRRCWAAATRGFDPRRARSSRRCAQDPVLSRVQLIAEPWDIGPGGYRLGGFPPGWLEWNDRFRDTRARLLAAPAAAQPRRVRAALHGLERLSSHAAARRRPASTSSPRTTASRLRDLVSYDAAPQPGQRRAQPRRPRPQPEPQLRRRRRRPTTRRCWRSARRLQRALLATLLLSQGTPMLLAGDELGHTPARQQQRLLPGQRHHLARLGRGRRRARRLRGARCSRCAARRRRCAAPAGGRPRRAGRATACAGCARRPRHGRRRLAARRPRRRWRSLFERRARRAHWLLLVNAERARRGLHAAAGRLARRLATDPDARPGRWHRSTRPARCRCRPASLWVAKT